MAQCTQRGQPHVDEYFNRQNSENSLLHRIHIIVNNTIIYEIISVTAVNTLHVLIH